MPLVLIECRRWMSRDTKAAVFNAVHDALVVGLKIPEDDRLQRIVEYAPDDFEIRPGRGERFTIITITAFVGRSIQAKKRLYRELATRLEPLGIPSNDLFVVLDEHPMENFGVRGGLPASEIDFGFKVEV